MRSLELRVVEVVVVLRESDKCVYDALGHEPSRETGEVELPLLRYPLGIGLVVLGLITFIYGILLVPLGSLGSLLLPPHATPRPHLHVHVLFRVCLQNS